MELASQECCLHSVLFIRRYVVICIYCRCDLVHPEVY